MLNVLSAIFSHIIIPFFNCINEPIILSPLKHFPISNSTSNVFTSYTIPL